MKKITSLLLASVISLIPIFSFAENAEAHHHHRRYRTIRVRRYRTCTGRNRYIYYRGRYYKCRYRRRYRRRHH
ncbi:MAG: hypothetical protein F6K61_10265 [Sphaerospermopsis sp. SIO1G1]|nr:hypothetical protein [Sphaerospermopsis sp. SIO1G1]